MLSIHKPESLGHFGKVTPQSNSPHSTAPLSAMRPTASAEANAAWTSLKDSWGGLERSLGVGRTTGTWSIFGCSQDLARSWHDSKELWSFYHVLRALKLTDIHLFLPPNLSFCIGHGSRMGMDPKQAGRISLKYITPCENHPCLQVIQKMSHPIPIPDQQYQAIIKPQPVGVSEFLCHEALGWGLSVKFCRQPHIINGRPWGIGSLKFNEYCLVFQHC